MDTSETYIEMCKKAEEIQALRYHAERDYWDTGDYLFWHVNNPSPSVRRPSGVEIRCQCWSADWHPSNSVWLPRQDQLQEMLNYKEPKNRDPHDWFCFGVPGYIWNDDFGYREEEDKEIEYYKQFTSMEQLWLAFVMFQLWNKVWDDDKWLIRG